MKDDIIFNGLEKERLKLQKIADKKLKNSKAEITYSSDVDNDKRLEVTLFYETRCGKKMNMTSYIFVYCNPAPFQCNAPLSFERLENALRYDIDNLGADKL